MTETAARKFEEFLKKYPGSELQKGMVLLSPGDSIESIYSIKRGFIQASTMDPSGRPLVINTFKPGSLVPLVWAICTEKAPYYFEAITKASIRTIPKGELIAFVRSDPELSFDLAQKLSSGLVGISGRLESLVLDPAAARLVSLLNYLGQNFGQPKDGHTEITLPLTHKQLASWIGTTRETVSLQMKTLKRKGLVSKIGGKISIASLALIVGYLMTLSGDYSDILNFAVDLAS